MATVGVKGLIQHCCTADSAAQSAPIVSAALTTDSAGLSSDSAAGAGSQRKSVRATNHQ